jgi:formylglycine-generating enzyme required for sulfatase activity
MTMRACLFSGLIFIAQPVAAAQPTHGNPVTVFRDCAVCPEMVVVPGGRFERGAAPDEEAREALADAFRHRSEPRHTATVPRFAVGRYEITRGQYRAFVADTGRAGGGCFVWTGTAVAEEPERGWPDPGYAQDDAHPAACVSWDDAVTYAAWLSRRTGKAYRLPTETEWEYVARGGTTTARFWGDDADLGCDHANGADLATAAVVPGAGAWPVARCNDGHAYTAPVGRFHANAFGLHDLLGNVAEWTQDCWNENLRGAPTDGRAWTSGDCTLRAVRGGGWDEAPAGVRAAYRVGSPAVIRVYNRGFRVVTSD